MRKIVTALMLAGAMIGSWVSPTAAQENGIVIQNNGVDSSHTAAGADNVNISRAPGNSSSNNGAGANNDAGRVVREKDRDRKDRSDRNATEEVAAPVEAPAAPAEGAYEAYAEGSEWVEPVPALAPQDAVADPAQEANAPIQLPNTGAGSAETLSIFAILAGVGAAAFGGISAIRRRPT